MFASTSSKVGRMGQNAPAGTVRLNGREPDRSMSSSDSLSEDDDVGESSGVDVGVLCQKWRGGYRVFFLSIAYSVRGFLERFKVR